MGMCAIAFVALLFLPSVDAPRNGRTTTTPRAAEQAMS
jgi:hypothetical protein